MKQPASLFSMVMCFVMMHVFLPVSHAQNNDAVTAKHIVRSTLTGRSYELRVMLPAGYSAADALRYPVLYLLDGKFSFPLFYALKNNFDLGKELKELIIVSIEGTGKSREDWLANRHHDFTPTGLPKADTIWSNILKIPVEKLRSGGAKNFLQVLQQEILPMIDSNYKTNGDRGLYGHSLGGLFASYCLLSAPGLFNRYAINSPSLWWNGNEILALENEWAKQHKEMPATVFLSMGSLEGDLMLNPFHAFMNSMKAHEYKGLQLTTQVFDKETHLSVVPACSSRTLKTLYGLNSK